MGFINPQTSLGGTILYDHLIFRLWVGREGERRADTDFLELSTSFAQLFLWLVVWATQFHPLIQKIQIHHSNLHFSMAVNLLFFLDMLDICKLKNFKILKFWCFSLFFNVEPTIWSQADTPLRHVVATRLGIRMPMVSEPWMCDQTSMDKGRRSGLVTWRDLVIWAVWRKPKAWLMIFDDYTKGLFSTLDMLGLSLTTIDDIWWYLIMIFILLPLICWGSQSMNGFRSQRVRDDSLFFPNA